MAFWYQVVRCDNECICCFNLKGTASSSMATTPPCTTVQQSHWEQRLLHTTSEEHYFTQRNITLWAIFTTLAHMVGALAIAPVDKRQSCA
eukprot:757893-Amphidinium_carterae.1